MRDQESVILSLYSKENCAPGFVRAGHVTTSAAETALLNIYFNKEESLNRI